MKNIYKRNIKRNVIDNEYLSMVDKKYLLNLIERDMQKKIIFDKNDLNICPTCKTHIMSDDKFCKHCGQSIRL